MDKSNQSVKQDQSTDEEMLRDVERRKMLILFCVVTWNMSFYVFALLPFASIYKIANPYWLALFNMIFSLVVGIILWKKQNLIYETKTASNDNSADEVV
jgi:hypothetical protein